MTVPVMPQKLLPPVEGDHVTLVVFGRRQEYTITGTCYAVNGFALWLVDAEVSGGDKWELCPEGKMMVVPWSSIGFFVTTIPVPAKGTEDPTEIANPLLWRPPGEKVQ